MFFFSRRRTRVLSLAMLYSRIFTNWLRRSRFSQARLKLLLLLASDRLGWTFARARIGVSPLAMHRQAAPVPQAAITAKIHQSLDIHCDIAPQIALDHVVPVDHFANLNDLRFG